MARIRTIKPEFPQSETVGKLSRDARLLFIQLWTLSDDAGRTRAAARMLASLLYPYDDDAPPLIEGWLAELAAAGCIRLYEVDGHRYLDIPRWLDHQKIDRAGVSKLPAFDEGSRAFVEASRALDEPSRKIAQDLGRDLGRERIGEEEEEAASAAGARALAISEGPGAAAASHAETEQAHALWMPVAFELGIPDPGFLNSERRPQLADRLRECGGIEGWKLALQRLRQAEWLFEHGKPKHWLNLYTLTKPENFTGLMEGRYVERHRNGNEGSLADALAGYARAGAR